MCVCVCVCVFLYVYLKPTSYLMCAYGCQVVKEIHGRHSYL